MEFALSSSSLRGGVTGRKLPESHRRSGFPTNKKLGRLDTLRSKCAQRGAPKPFQADLVPTAGQNS